jgi:hypothetical protein
MFGCSGVGKTVQALEQRGIGLRVAAQRVNLEPDP